MPDEITIIARISLCNHSTEQGSVYADTFRALCGVRVIFPCGWVKKSPVAGSTGVILEKQWLYPLIFLTK